MEKYKIGEENVNCRIDKIIPILNENITRVATQKLLEEGKILGSRFYRCFRINKFSKF